MVISSVQRYNSILPISSDFSSSSGRRLELIQIEEILLILRSHAMKDFALTGLFEHGLAGLKLERAFLSFSKHSPIAD